MDVLSCLGGNGVYCSGNIRCGRTIPGLVTSFDPFLLTLPLRGAWVRHSLFTTIALINLNVHFISLSLPPLTSGMRWYKGQSVPFMNVFNPDSQVRLRAIIEHDTYHHLGWPLFITTR